MSFYGQHFFLRASLKSQGAQWLASLKSQLDAYSFGLEVGVDCPSSSANVVHPFCSLRVNQAGLVTICTPH